MSQARIVVLPGDGTGSRLMEQAVQVAKTVCTIEGVELALEYGEIGYTSYLSQGVPFSSHTAQKCRAAHAVLLGPVGDERSSGLAPNLQPVAGVLALRAKLGLFSEYCPILIPERGVDFVIVRELSGGIYYGARGQTKVEEVAAAFDTEIYTEPEVERVAKNAFELARTRRGLVTSVDRADVLESSRLWRAAVEKTHSAYPDVALEHISVNRAAAMIITDPSRFDVLLCPNLFGSILASEAAAFTGNRRAQPRAWLGYTNLGVYTPACDSTVTHPASAILAVGMMFGYSFCMQTACQAVMQAVGEVTARAVPAAPEQMGELVTKRITQILA